MLDISLTAKQLEEANQLAERLLMNEISLISFGSQLTDEISAQSDALFSRAISSTGLTIEKLNIDKLKSQLEATQKPEDNGLFKKISNLFKKRNQDVSHQDIISYHRLIAQINEYAGKFKFYLKHLVKEIEYLVQLQQSNEKTYVQALVYMEALAKALSSTNASDQLKHSLDNKLRELESIKQLIIVQEEELKVIISSKEQLQLMLNESINITFPTWKKHLEVLIAMLEQQLATNKMKSLIDEHEADMTFKQQALSENKSKKEIQKEIANLMAESTMFNIELQLAQQTLQEKEDKLSSRLKSLKEL